MELYSQLQEKIHWVEEPKTVRGTGRENQELVKGLGCAEVSGLYVATCQSSWNVHDCVDATTHLKAENASMPVPNTFPSD